MPIQIGFSFYFLCQNYLGMSSLFGLISIFAVWLFSHLFAKVKKVYWLRKKRLKTSRLKQIEDLLTAIKAIKRNALELSYERTVSKIRNKELNQTKKLNQTKAFKSLIFSIFSVLVSFLSAKYMTHKVLSFI